MTILDRFAARLGYARSERRSSTISSADGYLSTFFGLRGIGAVGANPDAVLSASAVATACVSRRSQGLASVPLQIHKNVGQSDASRDESHPLWHLLNVAPNAYMSAFEFREFMVRSHDLFGNAYAIIERDGAGQVTALHPIPPMFVTVEALGQSPGAALLAPGRLRYRVSGLAGGTKVYLDSEFLHVRGPSRNGIMGLSPMAIASGNVGLALEQAETASAVYANGLQSSGVLAFDGTLDEGAHKRLTNWLSRHYAGSSKAGRPLILDRNAKFSNLTFSPVDSEFLASRKLAAEDVARIFDVPPTAVGLNDRATFSNVEQESLALVRQCFMPLAARFESALARCLLSDAQSRQFFIRHDFNELLRGDMAARFEAYRVAREAGIFSANDCRRLENEAPIGAEGDIYNQPINWGRLGSDPIAAPPGAP
jgi:HK97 family phage portal protein